MHDAEGARDAILNAGEEVFAEHGFDGARIDAIAKASGYNKSLIFQYFEDKLGLYAAVIRRADDQTRTWQNEALSALSATEPDKSVDHLKDLLRIYIGEYFDYLVEHPRIMRIYNWEMAEGWQTFSKILTQRDFDDVDEFMPVLARLQDAGVLRSKPEPIIQVFYAIFSCATYLAFPPLYKTLTPEIDFSSSKELAYAREFLVDFVTHGLLITPAKAKPGKK
jgi:AcrR family transcriptional regulator